jgi:hypothetical protein
LKQQIFGERFCPSPKPSITSAAQQRSHLSDGFLKGTEVRNQNAGSSATTQTCTGIVAFSVNREINEAGNTDLRARLHKESSMWGFPNCATQYFGPIPCCGTVPGNTGCIVTLESPHWHQKRLTPSGKTTETSRRNL